MIRLQERARRQLLFLCPHRYTTPCVLPSLESIESLSIVDASYHPIQLDPRQLKDCEIPVHRKSIGIARSAKSLANKCLSEEDAYAIKKAADSSIAKIFLKSAESGRDYHSICALVDHYRAEKVDKVADLVAMKFRVE